MSDAIENTTPLTPNEFTLQYGAMLSELIPDATVAVLGELSLQAVTESGDEIEVSLENPFRDYSLAGDFDSAFENHVKEILGSIYSEDDFKIELHCVVPVIKGTGFIEEVREQLEGRADGSIEDALPFFEPLNDHLSVFYVYDSADSVEYLTAADLASTEVPFERLRAIAIENLHTILPEIQLQGADGVHVLIAGGDYEVSLLLHDALWNPDTLPVDGEYIVGVPKRDLLLVTGSENRAGIEKIRSMVGQAFDSGSYPVSDQLFIRIDGQWAPFGG